MKTDENAKVTDLPRARIAASRPVSVGNRITQVEAADPAEPAEQIELPRSLAALLTHRMLATKASILICRRNQEPGRQPAPRRPRIGGVEQYAARLS